MFAGIIEAQSRILSFTITSAVEDHALLIIEKPNEFNDINAGDSVAINGVCLTVENADPSSAPVLQFSLGRETLAITGWTPANLANCTINLERSLQFGDRVHGHFVSGHVDARGTVVAVSGEGSRDIQIQIPAALKSLVYKKGSIAINGVSLTVNAVDDCTVSVCLIPETLKRTNLSALKSGDTVNVEADQFARAIQRLHQTEVPHV